MNKLFMMLKVFSKSFLYNPLADLGTEQEPYCDGAHKKNTNILNQIRLELTKFRELSRC